MPVWQLVPFPQVEHPDITVTVQVELHQPVLKLTYRIEGPALASILFPQRDPNSGAGSRKDLLWQHTCLEAFLTRKDSPTYWEFNFAPSDEWNCYQFGSYRAAAKTEERVREVKLRSSAMKSGDHFKADLEIDLSGVTELQDAKLQDLLVGLTAVIETMDGKKSYWALAHCGEKPDFHLRESFKAPENDSSPD